MERDPLLPSNVIEFKSHGSICAEWKIDKYDYAGGRSAFSPERFNYVVFDNVLFIHDLILGIKKKFVSEDPTIRLLRYMHLATNRGFVFYETTTSTRVSVIDIGFESDKYTFLGNSYSIFERTELGQPSDFVDDVSRLSEDMIGIKSGNVMLGDKLYLFKLNKSLSTIKFERTIAVPDNCQWFNKVGDKIVFARLKPETRTDRIYLDNFMTIDEAGDLAEIENTETCLQSRTYFNDCVIYPCGVQGIWSNGRFYIVCNLYPGDRSLPSTVFLSVFELEHRKWSEIRLSLPRIDQSYVKFNVSCGLMILLQHIEEYKDRELFETKVISYCFPVRTPQKLLKLVWAMNKESGLSDKVSIISPYTSYFD